MPQLVFREAMAEMINNLATGPFRMENLRSALGVEAGNTADPTPAPPPAAPPVISPEMESPKADSFVIEGTIRSDVKTH